MQLRKDLDLKVIYKRMESFVENHTVEHSFKEQEVKLKELNKKLKQHQGSIDKWKNLGSDIHEKIDAIFAR